MPTSVTMPRLGESVTEGTVTRWLKQEGERVEVDEPLLEVSTDKVDTEIPSPAAGVLTRIVVGEDETAEVGSELAVIAGEGEDAGAAAPAPQQQAEAEPEPAALTTPSTEKPVEEEAPAPQTAAGSAEGTEVKMPALGESVTEGTVTRWLKQVGETVEVDEPLLEVSTDKVDTEIPSPVAGTLLEIRVPEDETAEVGGVLAIVGSASSAPAAAPAPRSPPRGSRRPSRSRSRSRSRRRSRSASPTRRRPRPPRRRPPPRPRRPPLPRSRPHRPPRRSRRTAPVTPVT
ncbi:2-oxoglutarate dehydrogenase E2 component (dihydrolipoamide succinyltransferase) [Actinoplanes sp. SE50/110]|nr:2-oxoglutarate dehydrogenase E2 component (dihydrolipoamide succinyltransferase) [Actinoplanes sp. SE50/110]